MKINWDYIKFTVLILFVGFLFAFSSQRNAQRTMVEKHIVFMDDNNHFITHSTVNKLLIQNKEDVTSIAKEILDLNEMEHRLNKNPMISKAEVFVTIDGILGAKIKQRKPIARVAASTPFYLDEDGTAMPLSEVHAARVPIITGITNADYEEILPLLLKIRDDEFMKNHIIGIQKESDDELRLFLRVYDFTIEFGKPTEIDKKFQKFKAFYQKTINDNTISAYSLVNLKVNNQVIGTKK